jgi:hypothetical protein
MDFLYGLLFLAVPVAAVYFLIRAYKRTKLVQQQLQSIADSLGVECDLKDGTFIDYKTAVLKGDLKGREFFAHMETQSGVTFTIFRISCKNPGAKAIDIHPEGALWKIGKAAGVKDIQVGSDAFDKQYVLRSKDEDFVQKVMTNSICDAFAQAKTKGKMNLDFHRIQFEMAATIHNDKLREDFLESVRLAQMLAESVERTG